MPFLLGIEMIVHMGGRMCYGMLAARAEPHNEQNRVNLLLAFTQKNTVRYTGTGLIDDIHVYKGLPEEYAAEVINRRILPAIPSHKAPLALHIGFEVFRALLIRHTSHLRIMKTTTSATAVYCLEM